MISGLLLVLSSLWQCWLINGERGLRKDCLVLIAGALTRGFLFSNVFLLGAVEATEPRQQSTKQRTNDRRSPTEHGSFQSSFNELFIEPSLPLEHGKGSLRAVCIMLGAPSRQLLIAHSSNQVGIKGLEALLVPTTTSPLFAMLQPFGAHTSHPSTNPEEAKA